MTEYFEVIHRDGAARIGKLEGYYTPCIINPKAYFPKYQIMPPYHARKEIIEYFYKKSGYFGNGKVVHPKYPELSLRNDQLPIVIIGCANQLEKNARELVESIINIREKIPPDTALYAPALATPENLSMLIYIGVDLVDTTLPIILAYQDIYLTKDGDFKINTLHDFPCECSVCKDVKVTDLQKMPKIERAELLSKHNCVKLEEELKLCKEKIFEGTLREYVEKQCRAKPWLTATLRLIDFNYNYLEKRTPIARNSVMFANSMESMFRVEIQRFADRVLNRYKPPELDTLVLLPCSAKKPYSKSVSHKKFINAIGKSRKYLHEVIITSPLGIVPRELERTYPAAHYDVAVTGYWDYEERNWVIECLYKYLIKNKNYKYIIAHVDGAYEDIVKSVEKKLKEKYEKSERELEFIYTNSLENLSKAVENTLHIPSRGNLKLLTIHSTMRSIADYQFGAGFGEILIPDSAKIKRHQIIERKKNKLIATLVPQYGLLALTLEGGRILKEFGSYGIKIENFIPKGSILAPGVIDADQQIRPRDEVFFENEKVFGVGRAKMSGWEMVKSNRGIAVDVRDKE